MLPEGDSSNRLFSIVFEQGACPSGYREQTFGLSGTLASGYQEQTFGLSGTHLIYNTLNLLKNLCMKMPLTL